jgi:hypothetical protein
MVHPNSPDCSSKTIKIGGSVAKRMRTPKYTLAE